MNLPLTIRSSLSSRASSHRARILGVAALALGSAALSLGCAALPVTGVAATGEPLRIALRQEGAEDQAKIAEERRLEAERRAGLASMPPELPPSASVVTRWEVFQGPKKLDDEDFFRIGGDIEAADQIRRSREHAVGLNRAGWVVLGVGVAAIAGGLALRSTMTSSTMENSSPLSSVGGVIAGVGVLAGLIGGSVAAYGSVAASREHPLDDIRRARQVERAYNLRITLQPADSALPVATPKGAPASAATTPPATLPAALPGAPSPATAPSPSATPSPSSAPPASSAPPPPSAAPSPSSAPPPRAP